MLQIGISPVSHRRGAPSNYKRSHLWEFRQYFLKLFTREPGLSSAQFDAYLADFPRLSATEAAGCEGLIKEEEIPGCTEVGRAG